MKNIFKPIISYFKEWNWFELVYLFSFEIAFVVLGILFNQTWLSIAYSVLILLFALLMVKGKWYGYILGILGMSCYVWLSFLHQYWAEAVWHLAYTIPAYFICIVTWKKHQQNKVVKQRRITKLEVTLFIIISAIVCGAIWAILWALKSPQAWASAFAVTFSAMANYLAMRRSDFSMVAYCFDDIFVIALWLIPVLQGEIISLNVAVTMFAFLINDIYGVINWRKLKKQQDLQNQQIVTESQV